jgi:hypothetical protein
MTEQEASTEALRYAAVERRGDMDSYMQFMTELASGVELDEKTRTIIFGLLIGTMNSEVARKAVRGYQWILAISLLASSVLIGYLVWLLFQLQLALLIQALTGGG